MSEAPRAYIYRYSDPFSGKPVWRHTPGLWNGQRPAESLPLYERPQPTLAAALEVPEVKALVGLLKEAGSELAGYVEHDYPEATRAQYPSVHKRWERDMDLCHRIDAALEKAMGG